MLFKCALIFLTILCHTKACTQGIQARDSTASDSTVYSTLKARKYKVVLIGGNVFKAVSIDSLKGETLYISLKKGTRPVPVSAIKMLHIARRKRPVGRGIVFGMLSGISGGALIGFVSYQEPDPNSWALDFGPGFSAIGGAVVGGLGGIITGTLVGASSNRYKHYDFSMVPPSQKQTFMRRILLGQQ